LLNEENLKLKIYFEQASKNFCESEFLKKKLESIENDMKNKESIIVILEDQLKANKSTYFFNLTYLLKLFSL